ncbi:unnamed protein product [Lactuca virosa]|uniref:Uncharacterized protein n=1 Tax=Lactuca virosa TaxID=75947 RepID=A0AAU9LB00_9ASTR|nr:unnamed protein product [Lactuca virosa]
MEKETRTEATNDVVRWRISKKKHKRAKGERRVEHIGTGDGRSVDGGCSDISSCFFFPDPTKHEETIASFISPENEGQEVVASLMSPEKENKHHQGNKCFMFGGHSSFSATPPISSCSLTTYSAGPPPPSPPPSSSPPPSLEVASDGRYPPIKQVHQCFGSRIARSPMIQKQIQNEPSSRRLLMKKHINLNIIIQFV